MPEFLMNKGIERIPFAPVNPSVVSSSLTGAAMLAVQKSCQFKKSEYLCKILAFSCLNLHNHWIVVEIMQSKTQAKCCKNTAVISRRVRLELTTFDFNGLEYCFILNRSLPILFPRRILIWFVMFWLCGINFSQLHKYSIVSKQVAIIIWVFFIYNIGELLFCDL